MKHRMKAVCCLLMIAFSSLAMGGCPGQDAFVGGVADGLTDGVATVIGDFFANALNNDG